MKLGDACRPQPLLSPPETRGVFWAATDEDRRIFLDYLANLRKSGNLGVVDAHYFLRLAGCPRDIEAGDRDAVAKDLRTELAPLYQLRRRYRMKALGLPAEPTAKDAAGVKAEIESLRRQGDEKAESVGVMHIMAADVGIVCERTPGDVSAARKMVEALRSCGDAESRRRLVYWLSVAAKRDGERPRASDVGLLDGELEHRRGECRLHPGDWRYVDALGGIFERLGWISESAAPVKPVGGMMPPLRRFTGGA